MSVLRFKADLEAFAKKLDLSKRVVVKRFALDAWTRMSERTPVDTGRARHGWTIKEGEPSDFIPEEGQYGKPELPGFFNPSGEQSVFITNAVDYIRYLEDGSSKRAPAGMIRITLAELEAEAEFIINNS